MMRAQLTTLSKRLSNVVQMINPRIEDNARETRRRHVYDRLFSKMEHEHANVLERKQVIETRKEYIEAMKERKEKEKKEKMEINRMKQLEAEEKRLEAEAKQREIDKEMAELEKIKKQAVSSPCVIFKYRFETF